MTNTKLFATMLSSPPSMDFKIYQKNYFNIQLVQAHREQAVLLSGT